MKSSLKNGILCVQLGSEILSSHILVVKATLKTPYERALDGMTSSAFWYVNGEMNSRFSSMSVSEPVSMSTST